MMVRPMSPCRSLIALLAPRYSTLQLIRLKIMFFEKQTTPNPMYEGS